MKVLALAALMGAMNAVKLNSEHDNKVYELSGGWQRHLNGDPDFTEWFDVPTEKISVKDDFWGHEVQRVPHQDWLDKHVQTVKEIQATIPPYPSKKQLKEERTAIADS